MKLLHLHKYFYQEEGGIENYSYTLTKEGSKLKHEVYVIDGIKIFHLPRAKKLSSFSEGYSLSFRKQRIKKENGNKRKKKSFKIFYFRKNDRRNF
ncbi:MAG: hypothetical protein QW609_04455 [Candidatus Aenigmatarchaeota archaeon]